MYLENMTYDQFGQRTYVKYGNGAESSYTYEPVMRRLDNLKTTSSDGKTLQNITYKYDTVGNITNRNNNEFNTNDAVKRNSEQSYEYDEMDRLESSTGKFDYETWNPFWDKRVNTYTNEFDYNVTGKILHKTQENKGLLTETNETVTIAETTYDWAYEYSGSHPNAVTSAGTRTMGYDLNGNMTQMTDTAKSLTRTLNWDDENRLKMTVDASGTNSIVTTYEYDADGMRALKKGKYGTVQYVSDNYTVRNKDLISKHVFAGNTRLVSKVVMNEEKSGKMVATEQGSYYYHADHLGSSSVVTDKAGKFYEHLEYFPYGETWVHNKATSEQTSTPYKFTSKELDEETGLYAIVHRYYDPKLSGWTSADPAISQGRYFPVPPINDNAKERNSNLPGMGGVFNSINLDAYQYAGRNPVKLSDPDGNDIVLLQAFTGANNAGHTAMLVQVHEGSNTGKWMYISRNGTTLDGGKPVGPFHNSVHGVNHLQYFDSPEAFFKNQQDQVVAKNSGKSGKEVGEFTSKTGKIRYEEGLKIATSDKDDKKIQDRAILLEKDPYNLFTNNCNDLVDDSIDGVMFTSAIAAPNDWYNHMKDVYVGKEGWKVYNGNDNYGKKK